jgi:hypothetical protein
MSAYTKIADALDSMADSPLLPNEPQVPVMHPTIVTMISVSMRARTFLDTIPKVEIEFTTSLIMAERTVEIP